MEEARAADGGEELNRAAKQGRVGEETGGEGRRPVVGVKWVAKGARGAAGSRGDDGCGRGEQREANGGECRGGGGTAGVVAAG